MASKDAARSFLFNSRKANRTLRHLCIYASLWCGIGSDKAEKIKDSKNVKFFSKNKKRVENYETLYPFCWFWDALFSCHDSFHIGPHHIGHATDLCEVPEVVHCGATVSDAFFQRFKSDVQADFVAVFEAVGNCFGRD